MRASRRKPSTTPSPIGRKFDISNGFSSGVRQTLTRESVQSSIARCAEPGHPLRVQELQKPNHVKLPIGRTAKLVFEIDALRAQCSHAADVLLSQNPVDGEEFEECARLDDALAQAHNLLKA